jgi:ankyrin repeat protein
MSASPFVKAIAAGDLLLIQTFLTCGTDANFRNNQGDSALYLAAVHNQTAVAQLLLDSGANPNSCNSVRCN